MLDDVEWRVKRAACWFGGTLPANEQLESFSMYVTGAKHDPEAPDDITYHTFACLYPSLGVYAAADTAHGVKPLEWTVDARLVRETITAFTPPEHHVLHQRELAGARMPYTSTTMRWLLAVSIATGSRLPVAVMAFGHTRDNELSVYQQSVLLAPLDKLALTFKKAVPVEGLLQ